MEVYKVYPSAPMENEITVPGDKSISHRAVMLGAIAEGDTTITNFLAGADCLATIQAMRAMGVMIEGPVGDEVLVYGVGKYGLKEPSSVLNLANSGTSMRLLAGLLAGHGVNAILEGDISLMHRPMQRVVEPLAQMGAAISCEHSGKPPIVIHRPHQRLKGIDFHPTVASAQVKSAVLLAGLYAEGKTSVTEPIKTRDHTERMLEAFGYNVSYEGQTVAITGGQRLFATDIAIPGDLSSAAFFIVAAAMTPGAELIVRQVGINPSRSGLINILWAMGAHITIENSRMLGMEPVADLHIIGNTLKGVEITRDLVPLAIDEFPILLIAAANAAGTTVLTDAAELRVKESDRIQSMAEGLRALGISVETTEQGMIVQGGDIQGGTVNSHGDHRIAMAFAMAAYAAQAPITILNCKNVATSFPSFLEVAKTCGLKITSEIINFENAAE